MFPYANHLPVVQHLWETFYKPGKHRETWFQWKGKPLMRRRGQDCTQGRVMLSSSASHEARDYFERKIIPDTDERIGDPTSIVPLSR